MKMNENTIVKNIKCTKCSNTLPPHSVKVHLDETHQIHKCPHKLELDKCIYCPVKIKVCKEPFFYCNKCELRSHDNCGEPRGWFYCNKCDLDYCHKCSKQHSTDFSDFECDNCYNIYCKHSQEIIQDNLEKRTVKVLKNMCKFRGLTRYSRLRKNQLIKKITYNIFDSITEAVGGETGITKIILDYKRELDEEEIIIGDIKFSKTYNRVSYCNIQSLLMISLENQNTYYNFSIDNDFNLFNLLDNEEELFLFIKELIHYIITLDCFIYTDRGDELFLKIIQPLIEYLNETDNNLLYKTVTEEYFKSEIICDLESTFAECDEERDIEDYCPDTIIDFYKYIKNNFKHLSSFEKIKKEIITDSNEHSNDFFKNTIELQDIKKDIYKEQRNDVIHCYFDMMLHCPDILLSFLENFDLDGIYIQKLQESEESEDEESEDEEIDNEEEIIFTFSDDEE